MKTNFLLQITAILLSVLLIVTLTLGAMSKLPFGAFWAVAIFAVITLYSLYRKD